MRHFPDVLRTHSASFARFLPDRAIQSSLVRPFAIWRAPDSKVLCFTFSLTPSLCFFSPTLAGPCQGTPYRSLRMKSTLTLSAISSHLEPLFAHPKSYVQSDGWDFARPCNQLQRLDVLLALCQLISLRVGVFGFLISPAVCSNTPVPTALGTNLPYLRNAFDAPLSRLL